MDNLPIFNFVSHYSLKSILTIKELGKTREGSPDSIIDICKFYDIERPVLVDTTFSGFIEFFKNATAAKMRPVFGWKVTMCSDINDKTEESKKSESKLIIYIKNGKEGKGYFDGIKLHNLATTSGFYGVPRLDWVNLKRLFTKNLHICVPFYDNAYHMNALHGHSSIMDLSFTEPTIFLEDNFLPFDSLIENGLQNFDKNWERKKVQTVRYKSEDQFLAYNTYLCIQNRSCLSKPQISHFSSKSFNIARHYEN